MYGYCYELCVRTDGVVVTTAWTATMVLKEEKCACCARKGVYKDSGYARFVSQSRVMSMFVEFMHDMEYMLEDSEYSVLVGPHKQHHKKNKNSPAFSSSYFGQLAADMHKFQQSSVPRWLRRQCISALTAYR